MTIEERDVWFAEVDRYVYKTYKPGEYLEAGPDPRMAPEGAAPGGQTVAYRWDEARLLGFLDTYAVIRRGDGGYQRVSFESIVEPGSEAADKRHLTETRKEREARIGPLPF